MRKILVFWAFFVSFVALLGARVVYSQTPFATAEPEEATQSAEVVATPTPAVRPDLTQKSEETIGPLEAILDEQELGPVWPANPMKYAIRAATSAGVPPNTLVLLLLLPVVTAIIAAFRHIVGIRGFGIFLPAALAVTFVATGPVVGIGLFLVIVTVSTTARMVLRKSKLKLQYLPRMSLILLFVVLGVLGVLFAAPLIRRPDIANVSIFPVLILVLLAEDFSRVQLGKSASTAVNLTTETLILALVSFIFLTSKSVQEYALLNPEILILSVAVFNFFLGKYVGLRLREFWRFRKLILR
ncbi:MAG: 7TM domain-containing protein [Patescibacteria group bacterium]